MSQVPPPLPPPPVVHPHATPLAGLPAGVYSRPARPGVITAIGVVSIVVASISLIACLYTLMMLFVFSISSNYSSFGGPQAAGGNATLTTQPAAAPPVMAKAVAVGPRGLQADDRRAVAEGLSELRFLTPQRSDQLEELLAVAGQDIFPTSGEPLSIKRTQDLVLGHATGLTADPSAPGPDIFRTPAGRFELYDDRSIFYPADRGEPVRASTLTGTNPGLSPAQIETVIRQASSLNPSQLAALRTLLATPGQQHVSPVTIPTAIRSVQQMGDGSVYISFPNGFANIGPQGQTVTNNTVGAAASALALSGGRVRHSGTAMALAGFATLAELGLAVFLLVVGILTLRASRRGRRNHLIYAGVKIGLAILGGAALWWMATSYHDALIVNPNPQATDQREFATILTAQAIVMAAAALVYPIALLIVLQTRTVKDYYAGIE